MESSSSYCPFDGLPTEIMYNIFDYLDHESRKSASLACRRWEQIYSNYFTKRLVLCNYRCNDQSDFIRYGDPTTGDPASMLKHTQRPYRKMHLNLFFKDEKSILVDRKVSNALGELFQPRWLQQLVVLKLGMALSPERFTVQLSDAVAKMDHLQELRLHFMREDSDWPLFSKLKLVNASLNMLEVQDRLVLNHVIPYVVDCSNMRKLDIAHCTDVDSTIGVLGVAQKVGSSWWRLEPVEELCLVDDLNSFFRPNVSMEWFYQQMPYLRKLHFNGYTLRETMLRFICGSCVQLEELILSTVLVDTPNVLCHLSKLPRLRRFGICEIIGRREPLTFASVRLPKLEELLLGRLPLDWQSLASVQPISWLKIKLGSQQVAPICEVLCGQFVQLRLLWIDFYTFRHYRELLAELPKMNSLETLVLENVVYLCSLKALPPLPQLKRLIIYRCSKKVYERFHNNDALLANLVRDIQWTGVDDRVTEVLIELFKPRWLQQLVVLKLGMRVYPEKFTVELSDAVAKMDHLQELDLSLMRCTKDWPLFSQLKVKNATLDKLKVHGVWPGVIDCPNLRALELDFPLHNEYKQYLLHQKEEPCWSMKQLQELCIRGGLTFREQEVVDLSTGMEQFCKPMPQIKRLYFDYFIVSERLLRIICESFVHLESLMLHILKMDDSNALRHLEKLPNLHLNAGNACPRER
uniref:F-box domain-containing protein n=1 Tax=Anopheles coluzzii TaxID=1518534 RepID=A0A8W7PI89_ANOCL